MFIQSYTQTIPCPVHISSNADESQLDSRLLQHITTTHLKCHIYLYYNIIILGCYNMLKRCSLSASMIVSSTYLMFVIFFPLLFIPCPSSSTSLIKYSVYILNRHGDNIQPCRMPRFIVISSDVFFIAHWLSAGGKYF